METLTQALNRVTFINNRINDLVKQHKGTKSKMLQKKLESNIKVWKDALEEKQLQIQNWGRTGVITVANYNFNKEGKSVNVMEQFINVPFNEVEQLLKTRNLKDLKILEIKEQPTFYIESPL